MTRVDGQQPPRARGDQSLSERRRPLGFAPSNPLESAILVTLPPAAYTAIVSGVGNATGAAIVAVYAVQ